MVSMAAVGLAVGTEATVEASAACAAAQGMLSTLFPPVLALLHSSDSDIAMAGVPLLHAYVGKLKAGLKRAGNQLPEVGASCASGCVVHPCSVCCCVHALSEIPCHVPSRRFILDLAYAGLGPSLVCDPAGVRNLGACLGLKCGWVSHLGFGTGSRFIWVE